MSAVVVVEGLTKSFSPDFWVKPVEVLRGISFQLHKNRITGFVGFNGSGKTTTIKCMLGFVKPDAGSISLFDGASREDAARKIGFLPERPYYLDFLTGSEYLEHHWNLSAEQEDTRQRFTARRDELLEAVGLRDAGGKKLRSYSKGMLQRIGIAQALLRDPELLILDEPMSGLDPDGRALVRDLIASLRNRGKTVFFSSHLLSDMILLCDDIVALHQGKVIFEGPLPSLLEEDGERARAEAFASQALEKKFQDLISGAGK